MVVTRPIFTPSGKDFDRHFGEKSLEDALARAFESEDALVYTPEILMSENIEPTETKVIFRTKYNSDGKSRSLSAKPVDVERGYIYKIKNEKWIAASIPVNQDFYWNADVKLCNRTIKISTPPVKTKVGVDDRGRPIYEYISEREFDVPCVIESTYYSVDTNNQITPPDGQLTITLPYFDNVYNYEVNDEPIVDGNKYKVIDKITTEQTDKIGILIIKLDRIVGDSSAKT